MFRNSTSLLIAIILFASMRAIAFPGETRSYFNDWLVVCQNKTDSPNRADHCRANIGIRNKDLFPYLDGTIFQLSLQRSENSEYHIEFYHTLDGYYPSNKVLLQIDDHEICLFDAQIEGNLAKLTSTQSSTLIPLLKTGRWLNVTYTSQSGKHIVVDVSLRGSNASLLFIEEYYGDGINMPNTHEP